jgi:hypothetical protein
MRYAEFAAALERHPGTSLVFDFPHGRVRPGYHITELLSAAIRSVDCGGNPSAWHEAVLQLVEPAGGADRAWLSAAKASGILKKAAPAAPVPDDAELLVELRPEGADAARRYAMGPCSLEDGLLVFRAAGAGTQCKPAAKAWAGTGCCGSKEAAPAGGACCA